MAEHTPGPWEIGPECNGDKPEDAIGVLGSDDYIVADVWRDVEELAIRADANARLIAAAPELLEALKAVIGALRQEAPGTPLNNRRFDSLGAQANAAIAKAEGR